MIASATRRHVLQSSAVRNSSNQRFSIRNVRSSFFGNLFTASHSPSRLALSSSSRFYSFHADCRSYSTKIINDDEHCRTAKSLRFEDLNLHPTTLKALERQGIHKLTEIQERTYSAILNGNNIVARARTGTGKTLAFLVPCIERIMKSKRKEGNNSSNNKGIPILILAPTRELAAQINMEAEKIFSLHNKQHDHLPQNEKDGVTLFSSQVIYGGSSKEEDVNRFERQLPTILVATPGRLKDHFQIVSFRSLLQGGKLRTLILDETDRLLELGFRRDVKDILSCLHENSSTATQAHPTQSTSSRQTLLFSATLAPDIMDVVDMVMSTSYQMVDCIHEEDPTTHTNINTAQSYIVLPAERFWTGTIESILHFMTTMKGKESTNKKRNKIIVFFEMTRLAQLFSRFLSLRLGHTAGVWEIHSRMHQRERTMVTRRFRNASHGILLTSDVSARGVDYPDVSHVIQVGASQNRETYIHRLGRTGRAGKLGQGILIIPEPELYFVQEELKGLDLKLDRSLQQQLLSKNKKSAGYGIRKVVESELGMLRQDLVQGTDSTGMAEALHQAYQSLISYYFNTRRRRNTGERSVESFATFINQLVKDFGLPELPAIDFRRAKSMGIEKVSDLNVRKNWGDQNWTFNANDEFQRKVQRKEHDNVEGWFGLSRVPELNAGESTPVRTKGYGHRRGENSSSGGTT
eukprot:jgi/Psemu1/249819/estExt_Genewise1Plus.C_80122